VWHEVLKKGWIKYLCGFGLAALALWWVLRGVDAGSVWRHLKQASVWGILAAITLNIGHNIFRVWRWRALLEPITPNVPFRPMFTAIMLGYMTSWVIPGRMGELVRPLVLSARQPVPLGPCLGTVVADRILDAATIVALFAVGSWITPLEGRAAEYAPHIRTAALGMAVATVVLLILMLVVSAAGKRLVEWFDRRRGLLRWAGRSVVSLASGSEAFRSPRLMLRVLLHSALAWLTISLATWIGIMACGAAVSFGAVLIILPMLALGVAVPTPGGMGTYHGAMKLGLMLFSVSEALAVSSALLMHASIVVPMVLLGLLLLWTEKISWKEFITAAQQFKKLGHEIERPAAATTVESMP
jgi:uncharacterized protein (TIRG00374 family)